MTQMTIQETIPTAAPAAEAKGPSAGSQLRAAREALGMSVADAAQAIRLSPKQITLLETDAWDLLPGETFVRGFLRNYARLLKLDSEPLLATLRPAEVQPIELPEGPHAEMPVEGGGMGFSLPIAIAGVVLLVAAIGTYFLWPEGPTAVSPPVAPAEQAAAETAAPPPMQTGDGRAAEPSGATGDAVPATSVREPVVAEPVTPPASAVEPPRPVAKVAVPAPAPNPSESAGEAAKKAPDVQVPQTRPVTAADGPERTLRFTIRELSWVEVHDVGGNSLLAYNFDAGMSRTIRGIAPLEVVIGNAANVDLTVDGKAVDVAAQARANVARITVD